MQKTTPSDRGAAYLPLLRTLSAIRQKCRELSFWEMIDSFVFVAYPSLAASRTLLQRLLTSLNFTFDSKDLFLLVQTKNMISISYGSSTSCWKPRGWVRFDLTFTMRNIYINSNLNPFTKFTSSSRGTEFKDIFPWNISQMITKTIPISMTIVATRWNGDPVLSLLESQRKLKLHDQNFSMEGKPL